MASTIQAFLACKRVAMVGVSRNPNHFTRALYKELVGHGYDVVPVNPNPEPIDGVPMVGDLRDVEPPVEAAYVVTPAEWSAAVVDRCAEAGIRLVWLHRGAGQGAVSPEAVRAAEKHGVRLVPGECVLMFLTPTHWVHRAHKGLKWLFGTLPS